MKAGRFDGGRCLRGLCVLMMVLLGGCAQVPRASVVGEQEQIMIPDRPVPRANGSIYQAHRGYQPLFEDRRPRMVGDILTIVLDEEVSASKNARSNADRNGSSSLGFDQQADAIEQLTALGFDISPPARATSRAAAAPRPTTPSPAPSPSRWWR